MQFGAQGGEVVMSGRVDETEPLRVFAYSNDIAWLQLCERFAIASNMRLVGSFCIHCHFYARIIANNNRAIGQGVWTDRNQHHH